MSVNPLPTTGTVLYTTEEGGAPLVRPLPLDGTVPPLTLHDGGQLYQLSLVVHHRHKSGGYAHV